MNIEIGKTYQVSNKYKKCYVEYEYLKNYDTDPMDTVVIETGWRSGNWFVTPQEEHEVEMLVEAMADDFEDELEMNDFSEAENFSEAEMIDSWDGCWDDWDWTGYKSKEGEELEEFIEEVQEEGMFYLLDNGFDTDECICVFQGQVIVEPKVEKAMNGSSYSRLAHQSNMQLRIYEKKLKENNKGE